VPRLLISIVALLLVAGAPASAMPRDEARHLLVRSGFAATPRTIDELRSLGRGEAVAGLLNSAGREAVTPPPDWIGDWVPLPQIRSMEEDERRAMFREILRRSEELKAWWYREMVATPTPLTEVMTLFWHNHFTSALSKVRSPVLMYRQNVTLRRHALGNFGEMLRAVARDPAMLLYLDGAMNRKTAPNENFARELLELFTLGEGHYGEADIKEAARAFTGWSIDREDGGFKYRRMWHDRGAKTVLGHEGRLDGDEVIDILLAHPRTAEVVVAKLWRSFVSESPDPAEAARLAALFRAADYEIKPLLQALFTSEVFYAPRVRGRLVKSPVELIVGTLRQFDLPVDEPRDPARIGRRLGQDILDPPSVKGWPGGTAWITSDSLLIREMLLARITGGEGGYAPGEQEEMRAAKTGMVERRARMSALLYDRWVAALPPAWSSAEAIAALLLPILPVETTLLDLDGSGALVRRLLRDPAYQLK
jgi:uncharacterized protein (DUF1800 family)